MRIRHIIYTLLLMLQVAIPEAWAQQKPESPDSAYHPPLTNVRVSLLTAMPGPEVYELYGHLALRVTNPVDSTDAVYNYGLFDFNSPGFVPRFVRGETDYMVGECPFWVFMQEYENRGSQVIEQELNLTPEQKQRLIGLLDENIRPENCVYRYKYLSNNCATQILDKIDEATDHSIIYPTADGYSSWRTQMSEFNDRYPWYQFGIDLALGAPLDDETTARQEMFMPVVLQQTITQAHYSNGNPLIKETRVVNQGRGDMRLGPTPWYLTPLFVFWLVAALVLICLVRRKENLLRIAGMIWMIGCGLVGLVIWFLIFVSVHEATSPNILGLWVGPQCFVAAWIMLVRNPRKWMTWYMRLYAVAVLLTALLALCGVQYINSAMWPILLTTILLTLSKEIYALPCFKK